MLAEANEQVEKIRKQTGDLKQTMVTKRGEQKSEVAFVIHGIAPASKSRHLMSTTIYATIKRR